MWVVVKRLMLTVVLLPQVRYQGFWQLVQVRRAMGLLPPGVILFECIAAGMHLSGLVLPHCTLLIRCGFLALTICELCRATATLPRLCLLTSRIPRLVSPEMAFVLRALLFNHTTLVYTIQQHPCFCVGCICFQRMFSATACAELGSL